MDVPLVPEDALHDLEAGDRAPRASEVVNAATVSNDQAPNLVADASIGGAQSDDQTTSAQPSAAAPEAGNRPTAQGEDAARAKSQRGEDDPASCLGIRELAALARRLNCKQVDIIEAVGFNLPVILELGADQWEEAIMPTIREARASRALDRLARDTSSEEGSSELEEASFTSAASRRVSNRHLPRTQSLRRYRERVPNRPVPRTQTLPFSNRRSLLEASHYVAQCPICLEDLHRQHIYQSGCIHSYHRWCFRNHVTSKITEGEVSSILCPECPREVTRQELVGPPPLIDVDTLERYDRISADRSLARDRNRRPCPNPGCDGILSKPLMQRVFSVIFYFIMVLLAAACGGASGVGVAVATEGPPLFNAVVCALSAFVGILLAGVRWSPPRERVKWSWPVTCAQCGDKICFTCGEPAHAGVICPRSSELLTEMWASGRDAMRCPQCLTMIERSQGCNHMTCDIRVGGCGYEFCWVCGGKYRPGHFQSFGCPDHGGAPAGQDALKNSFLGLLREPALFAAGVVVAEAYFLPVVGSDVWICGSALAALAFLIAYGACYKARAGLRFLVLAPLVPTLAAALCFGWWELRLRVGNYYGVCAALVALELGIFSVASACLGLRKRDAAIVIGCTLAAIVMVEMAVGISALIQLANRPLMCSGKRCTWATLGLRWLLMVLLSFEIMVAWIMGCISLIVGFCKVLETAHSESPRGFDKAFWNPFTWIAGIAVAAALLATMLTSPAVTSFDNTGVWMFCVVLGAMGHFVGLYYFQQVVMPGIFPRLVTLPLVAFCMAWLGHLLIELVAFANGKLPHKLPEALACLMYLFAGLTSGTSIIRYWQRRRACVKVVIAFLAGLFGVVLGAMAYRWRGFETGLWVQRLFATACFVAVLVGTVTFKMGWHFRVY